MRRQESLPGEWSFLKGGFTVLFREPQGLDFENGQPATKKATEGLGKGV